MYNKKGSKFSAQERKKYYVGEIKVWSCNVARENSTGPCRSTCLFVDLNAGNAREIFYWQYEQWSFVLSPNINWVLKQLNRLSFAAGYATKPSDDVCNDPALASQQLQQNDVLMWVRTCFAVLQSKSILRRVKHVCHSNSMLIVKENDSKFFLSTFVNRCMAYHLIQNTRLLGFEVKILRHSYSDVCCSEECKEE